MNPSEERQHRLQQVRDEIERELGQGIDFFADDWLRRYAELEPDLGVMLREMIARGMTEVAAGPTVDTAAASASTAISPSLSPSAPPAETLALSTLPGPASANRTGPSSDIRIHLRRRSSGRPSHRPESPLLRRLRDHLHPRPGRNGRRLQGAASLASTGSSP